MKKLTFLLGVCCSVLISFAQVPGNDMFSIAQIKNGIKSKRISRYYQSYLYLKIKIPTNQLITGFPVDP